MSYSVQLDVELPGDLARFKLPAGVGQRLTELLEKQDAGEGLTERELTEAEGLVDLADTLTYLRLKLERVG